MKTCRYCHGRGVLPVEQPRREPAARGVAVGTLPPFGREVEEAVRAGRADASPWGGVDVFCRVSPSTGEDAWKLAAWAHEHRGQGLAMVLPEGKDVAEFRWPTIPRGYEDSPQVVFWAFGFTAEEEQHVGKALIAAGYDIVDVRGGPTGPHRFVAR